MQACLMLRAEIKNAQGEERLGGRMSSALAMLSFRLRQASHMKTSAKKTCRTGWKGRVLKWRGRAGCPQPRDDIESHKIG